MNKAHWNSIVLNEFVPDGEIRRMVDNSYSLVVKGMTKAPRTQLETRYTALELHGLTDTT